MRTIMPASRVLVSLTVFSFVSILAATTLPGTPPSHALQSIVDSNDVLGEPTPATFAATSLKNLLESYDSNKPVPQERPAQPTSKTAVYNTSLLNFITKIYNHKSYAMELSQNATHVIQFMDFGNELQLGSDAMYVVWRLFYNKMKATEIVDDSVVLNLLDATPKHLERYFAEYSDVPEKNDLQFIKKQIESMILGKFTRSVDLFKREPDTFVSHLAQELAQHYDSEISQVRKAAAKQELVERLRHMIIRFYDTTLGKVMWNPQQPEAVWSSFTTMAQGLQRLGEYNIIKHMDDLDDLLWSLTHRFCYFLDLTGASLPLTFYERVERDLAEKSVYFLEFREQDEGVTSKKSTVLDALAQAKTRAIAYEKKGIISAPVMFR
jgi:hypothetical protein